MSERKVNDMLTWIENVKNDEKSAVLPESISQTRDMIIEIEEIIETITVRGPAVTETAGTAYSVTEKYDASRKFTIEGTVNNREILSFILENFGKNKFC